MNTSLSILYLSSFGDRHGCRNELMRMVNTNAKQAFDSSNLKLLPTVYLLVKNGQPDNH
jgi:hypothetical protein